MNILTGFFSPGKSPEMSTGPQVKAELSPLFGLHPSSFDRYLRDLAAAGLSRRSGLGGGKSAVHLNDEEISRVVLSMASSTPGGAAAAIEALERICPLPVEGAHSSLTSWFAGLIASVALMIRRGENVYDLVPPDWALTISLDPLIAWATVTGPDGTQRKQFFREVWPEAPINDQPPAIQRLTIISKTAVLAAAQLAADNGQRSAVLWEPPAPAPAEASENETVAPLPRVSDG